MRGAVGVSGIHWRSGLQALDCCGLICPVHPALMAAQDDKQTKRNAVPGKGTEVMRADVTQQPAYA